MRRLFLASLVALAWLVSVPAAQAPAPAAPPPDLDAYVARVLTTFDVPGVSLVIVKDGRAVVAKGPGNDESVETFPPQRHLNLDADAGAVLGSLYRWPPDRS